MDRLEAAALIGGVSRAENKPVSQPTNVHFVTMDAVSDSEDGTVLVDPGGDVFSPDESQYVEIETVGSVAEGDEITVALVGEPGGGMDVISLGPVGEGDTQNESIDEAKSAAETAWEWAVEAHSAAVDAQESADNAANSARTANSAASNALVQLSVVEDVAGTLQWISDHGTFTATTDTTVQDGVVYFAYDGGDYVPIAEPTGDPSAQGWYVLDVSESQTDYIMSHIAVTSRGLWVLPNGIGSAADEQHAAGYKVLLSPTGMTVYDGTGAAVATYGGQGISFAQDRSFYVGDEDAYILFDGDGHITIGGAVTLGESKTLSEVLAELEADTSTDVVGRNLLRKTGSVTTADLARTRSSVPEAGVIRLNPTTSAAYAKFRVDYLDFDEYGDGTYTVSFDARLADVESSYTANNLIAYLGFNVPSRIGNTLSGSYDRYTSRTVATDTLTSDWQRLHATFDVPDDLKTGQASALASGSYLTVQLAASGSRVPAEVRRVKLERGLRATTWAPAMEDVDEGIGDAAKTATDYITDVTSDGIWVTPSDAKPVSGAAAATTSGWHIADALELFRQGASVFRVWVESNMTKLRIGDESGKHLLMDGEGISLKSAAALMARIKTVTNMTTITGRFTFDSGDRAFVEGGYNQTNRSAEVEIVADHGESGDTSPYGHRALISFASVYDGIRQRYESSIELAADTIGLSDAENATTTVGMQQAMSHIIGGIELYAGSYSASASSSITLSESAANFSRLLVEYEDSTGRKGSVWVDSPDGSTFSMQTVGGNSSAGMVTRFKTAVASGTTIDTQKDSYNRYTYGKVTVSTSGGVTYANAQEIGITKVVGFR